MGALPQAAGAGVPIVWRGQGFRDGGEDCEQFRRAAHDGRVRSARQPAAYGGRDERRCGSCRGAADPAREDRLRSVRHAGQPHRAGHQPDLRRVRPCAGAAAPDRSRGGVHSPAPARHHRRCRAGQDPAASGRGRMSPTPRRCRRWASRLWACASPAGTVCFTICPAAQPFPTGCATGRRRRGFRSSTARSGPMTTWPAAARAPGRGQAWGIWRWPGGKAVGNGSSACAAAGSMSESTTPCCVPTPPSPPRDYTRTSSQRGRWPMSGSTASASGASAS